MPTNNYYQGGIPNQVTAQNFGGRVRLQPLGGRPVLLPRLRHDVLRVQRRLDLRDEVRRAALQRQDARLVVVHRQLDEGPRVDGHRHAVLGQPLLRGSAAAGTAQVQAHRRRSARLPGRVLPGGEQLHAADHQHRRATRACRPTPTAVCETTNFQAQSSVTNVMGTHTLRGGVDYRLAMRRAGLMTAGNVSSTYNFDNTLHARGGHDGVFPASNIGLEPGRADARASRRRCRSARTRRSR